MYRNNWYQKFNSNIPVFRCFAIAVKLVKTISLIILIYFPALAQKNITDSKNFREKVYLQTDRSYYSSGDTIWGKAIINYKNVINPDSVSKVLHVAIYSSDKTLISTSSWKIHNGESVNAIVIPERIPTSNYYLLVYWHTQPGC